MNELADLPTYSALRLLERMAGGQRTISQIRGELERVDRAADKVTPSMRFVHAATVTLLMSPLLIALMVFLLISLVIRFGTVLSVAQTLASINYIQMFPNNFSLAFKGLTPEQSDPGCPPTKSSKYGC